MYILYISCIINFFNGNSIHKKNIQEELDITTHPRNSKTPWIRSDFRYWRSDTNTSGRLDLRREHTYGLGRSSVVSSNTSANMKHSTASSPHISARPHSRAWTGTSVLGRSGYSVCSCPGSWARSSGCSSCRCPRILRLPIYTVNLLKIKTKMCNIIMYKCMFFFQI